MDAPNLAKLSFCNGGQEKIAPVHPDFSCEDCSLVPDGYVLVGAIHRLRALEVRGQKRALSTTV
jgi:hypothetical protein